MRKRSFSLNDIQNIKQNDEIFHDYGEDYWDSRDINGI